MHNVDGMQQRQKEKILPTYAAIRIWSNTRTLLREIGHKTETYDKIIQNLINSYIEKEETTSHRVVHKQDWTPMTYGNRDATREDTHHYYHHPAKQDDDKRGEQSYQL